MAPNNTKAMTLSTTTSTTTTSNDLLLSEYVYQYWTKILNVTTQLHDLTTSTISNNNDTEQQKERVVDWSHIARLMSQHVMLTTLGNDDDPTIICVMNGGSTLNNGDLTQTSEQNEQNEQQLSDDSENFMKIQNWCKQRYEYLQSSLLAPSSLNNEQESPSPTPRQVYEHVKSSHIEQLISIQKKMQTFVQVMQNDLSMLKVNNDDDDSDGDDDEECDENDNDDDEQTNNNKNVIENFESFMSISKEQENQFNHQIQFSKPNNKQGLFTIDNLITEIERINQEKQKQQLLLLEQEENAKKLLEQQQQQQKLKQQQQEEEEAAAKKLALENESLAMQHAKTTGATLVIDADGDHVMMDVVDSSSSVHSKDETDALTETKKNTLIDLSCHEKISVISSLAAENQATDVGNPELATETQQQSIEQDANNVKEQTENSDTVSDKLNEQTEAGQVSSLSITPKKRTRETPSDDQSPKKPRMSANEETPTNVSTPSTEETDAETLRLLEVFKSGKDRRATRARTRESQSTADNEDSDEDMDADKEEAQQKIVELMNDIIKEISKEESAKPFRKPVTEQIAAGYEQIILQKRDLSWMRRNIKNGNITTIAELWRNIALMFQNAVMFNPRSFDIHQQAKELRAKSRALIQKALSEEAKILGVAPSPICSSHLFPNQTGE